MPTLRRGYLELMRHWEAYGESGTAMLETYRSFHSAATPATPLPSNTPGRAKLIAAGYTAIEDVQGATVGELVDKAQLSQREAAAVIAAYPDT